ncbi:sugar phosphate isomerase/epimerase [Bacteroides sp. 51]|uniref:sugar phosphate isomerase/epimerase family protein n=1 Tax=Bacteroides sp. 51 TaxID=2302938 RepID=UPI001EF265F9|nr:sugar phosphate isomerase/epimerase [Bacteroides sp. 51]
MKKVLIVALATVAVVLAGCQTDNRSDYEKMGWKVGIQSYTFTKFSLFEAIDAASDLGLKYVEATTWQRIEPDKKDAFNPWWMSAETKQKIKDKCAEKGVEIVSFYCRPSKEDIEKESEQVEKIFQFCQEMNLILTTDPIRVKSGFGSMEFYDNLCQKYGVTMVLTNHPKSHGSPYWNADDVLEDCAGRSKYIGASVDVGHFMRDGTDPYEAVRKYTDAGRMYHFHFRDVDSEGKDVALGDGAAHIKEMLAYMYEKKATPILVFEYERDQEEPLKYIVPSLGFLNREATELLKK